MNTEPSWIAVLPVGEIERNGVTLVRAADRDYVICDAPDRRYASVAYCTHRGALLRDGCFDGHLIECPLHQGCFDIRSGEPKGAPATRRLRVIEVRTREGRWSCGSDRDAPGTNRSRAPRSRRSPPASPRGPRSTGAGRANLRGRQTRTGGAQLQTKGRG